MQMSVLMMVAGKPVSTAQHHREVLALHHHGDSLGHRHIHRVACQYDCPCHEANGVSASLAFTEGNIGLYVSIATLNQNDHGCLT